MAINYVTTELNVSKIPYAWAGRHMQVQMLRNFATATWVFQKADGTESVPGCIIASPSLPDGAIIDQDYVYFWIRDGAVCVVETLDNRIIGNGPLDDYVVFSKTCQDTAQRAGCPDRACFTINGNPRPNWTDQTDGTAHRIDSLVEIFNRLGSATREMALVVIRNDVDHLLQVYNQPTYNLWEETRGESFFARSVQQRALRRVLLEARKYGLSDAQTAQVNRAVGDLAQATQKHRKTQSDGQPYYASILNPTNGDRGANLNVDVVMAVSYGAASCRDEVILSTAAILRKAFYNEFPVNQADAKLGLGPVIGRYIGDTYDGNNADANQGHPWPLATCNFAELYYRVAGEILDEGANTLYTPAATAFFGQVDIQSKNDPSAVGKLIGAGDAMLSAVLYHSDQLELSEQIDRNSGYQTSVRGLTWSYAAFLHALKARERAVGPSFAAH